MKKVNSAVKPALPIVRIFKNLHISENLERAKAGLKELSGIYCFRHIASGKIYIGQTVNLSDRIMDHINGNNSNIILQRAITKYGVNNFEFLVVEFVTDTSLLTTSEQVHLDWLFSLPLNMRYNVCSIADSRLGSTHTAETKAAISAANTGRTLSAETKALMSKSHLGSTHSAESKALMTERKLGTTHSAETKALMSERKSGENHPMYGKTHTAETKGLIRLNQPSRKSIFVYEHETLKLVVSMGTPIET